MDKQTQDKSSLDNKSVTGQDPDRYEQGYGSFTEEDFDKKKQESDTLHVTPGGTETGTADKANIIGSRNEDKSTISNDSAPSKDVSDVQEDKGE